jgi:hypothetical protein
VSADYFLPCFALFSLSAGFLWLVGSAVSSFESRLESLFRAPWLGCGILVGVLQIAHFFSPINRGSSIIVLAVLLAFAALKLLVHLPRMTPSFGSLGPPIIWLTLLAVVSLLAFVPVFNCCTKDIFHYDLGLYYLKTIRWIESFPVVRGLVNLQPHLGFNQSAFLLTSVLDTLVPNRRGIFFIGGVLPWLGLSLSFFSIVRMAVSQFWKVSATQPIEIAYAISLPAWIFVFVGGSISGASPDSISFCLMLHFFLVFSCFIMSSDAKERCRNLGEIFFVGATSLCVKPSSFALVGGALIICSLSLLLSRERLQLLLHRRVVLMSVLSAVVLTTWTGRGVMLSGYPLFPASAVGMPVPWRMPVKQVDSFRGMTIAWARDPDPNGNIKRTLRTWRWLPGWFQRVHSSIDQLVWSAQVGLVGSVVLASAAAMGRLRGNFKGFLLLAAPLLLHSIFWFLTVPEPKYFRLAAWLFALCPALTFINRGLRIGFASSIANLCMNVLPVFIMIWDFRWSWSTPGTLPPELHVVETVAVTNSHGVQVWIPLEGDRTFDSPIPSGKGPAPEVAFLDPQRGPAGGFKFLRVNSAP